MPLVTGRDYPKLIAPKADQEMLIWPEPRQLLRSTWGNHQSQSDTRGQILGIPLPQLRGWMRRWLGVGDDTQPLLATGHQAELYHPGVWIKNAVIAAAAKRLGGMAVHVAVDTDAPKHLMYRWPGGGMPISDDPELSRARWSGLVRAPTEGYVRELQEAGNEAAREWGYEPAWAPFFAALLDCAGKSLNLPGALNNAHHFTDRSLGIDHQTMLASPMWRTAGYLAFAYDICSRAGEYAAVYNGALHEFRETYGIASPGRPMPDLEIRADICEIPFWLDNLDKGSRGRACLARNGEAWVLKCDADEFQFDAQARDGFAAAERLGAFLSAHDLRLSPRALTLTGFLRLLVVDQFTHGIGGAIYDQVTDRILASWYGIEPPAFSVATATLFFPPASRRERTCVECLEREARDLRHGLLGSRKMDLVAQIAAAPRRSSQRAILFSQMHRELAEALVNDPRAADLDQRLRGARARYAEDQVLFDRELPYTLQSRERLEEMVGRVEDAFG